MGDFPRSQWPSLDSEIEARRRARAKRVAAIGALVTMFLAGYCARGRVSADRASGAKHETADPRVVANGDGVKMIVDPKAVTAPPRQVTASALQRAIAVTELTQEVDQPLVAEDRAADVAAEKKRGRAGKATFVAAKPSPATVDAPSGDQGGGGSCTLSINSIPISRVAVDGRPMGFTPAQGVSVSAGTHNVLFVTDTIRKTTTTTCKPGEKKSISLRLTP